MLPEPSEAGPHESSVFPLSCVKCTHGPHETPPHGFHVSQRSERQAAPPSRLEVDPCLRRSQYLLLCLICLSSPYLGKPPRDQALPHALQIGSSQP